MIDIVKMNYFVTIVEMDFNLTKSSKKLFISQPALSKFINTFENDENLDLFVKRGKRLVGLTRAGEKLYEHSKMILSSYNSMMSDLKIYSKVISGTIKLGIPPLIMTVLFTEIMTQLVLENPQIKFEIIEIGAFDLKKKLLTNELDMAILITPTGLNSSQYIQETLFTDELTLFMSKDNQLASKDNIVWKDLTHRNLAIFNDTFMIHHQIINKFMAQRIIPTISMTSGLWDYLVDVTRNSDFITIMPSPIKKFINMDNYKEVRINNPIPWEVVMVYHERDYYSQIELYVRKMLMKYFRDGERVKPLTL